MMAPVKRIHGKEADAINGKVVIDKKKIVWNGGHITCALFFAPFAFSIDALLLFLISTFGLLLVGHSVGMHRLMIHQSFTADPWLERCLIYCGVLVGMAGPKGIIKIHDLRDWAQRQSHCHEYFSHKRSYFRDLSWQLFYRFSFRCPPKIVIEKKYATAKFTRFLNITWPLHQLPLAIFFYYLGGWPYVVWGISVRISVSIIGHWSITYFCHNPGAGRWQVKNAAVQASNISGLGIITFGECWHNNHHAFPESARIGLDKGQSDPGWWLIKLFAAVGWVKRVGSPRAPEEQDDLIPTSELNAMTNNSVSS